MSYHRWTEDDFELLAKRHAERVPMKLIALEIGSTVSSCFQHSSQLGLNHKRSKCIVCGKRLRDLKKRGRKKEYCSPHCMQLLAQARKTNERINTREHTHCLNCGARLIPPWSSRRKWCSKACGNRGWYVTTDHYGGGPERGPQGQRTLPGEVLVSA